MIINIIDKDVENLRALGVSIPRGDNKIIKCKKLENQSFEFDISNMIEPSKSCVLMEREKILGMLIDFFNSKVSRPL